MVDVPEEFCREFLGGCHEVGEAGLDGAPWHAVVLRGGGVLDHRHAHLLLDGPEAQRAVRAHAGEDDPDGPVLLVERELPEEGVDGEPESAGGRGLEKFEDPVQDGEILVRRDDVDLVRLHLQAVPRLRDLHRSKPLDELGHDPLVGGVEVRDEDEGVAGVGRHIVEELFEGLERPGRSADAHDELGVVRAPDGLA